jgi:ribosomal-protein-alanine N-acetyltransferase
MLELAMIIRLETERLRIEPFQLGDAGDLFAWASDPETTRYLGWKRHQSLADSESVIRYFENVRESEPPKFDRPLAFRDKRSQRVIGSGGIHQFGDGIVELGWILRREFRRQGLAHEAAAALFGFAMQNLPWVNQVKFVHIPTISHLYA